MMRLVDVLYSVPFIFIVIFLLTILGQEDVEDVARRTTASTASRSFTSSSARSTGSRWPASSAAR